MGVDLRSTGFFARVSYLVEPDSLVKLEHGYSKDRIRKVGFDRVEQMVVWRQLPGVRIAICGLFGVLGLLLLLPGDVLRVIGVMVLLLSGSGIAYFLYCRKTTIRLVRGGRAEDVTGVFWPSKVKKVVAQIAANIEATQTRGFALLAEKEAARVATGGVTSGEAVQAEGMEAEGMGEAGGIGPGGLGEGTGIEGNPGSES